MHYFDFLLTNASILLTRIPDGNCKWNEDSTISENVNNTTLDLTLTIDLKFYGRKSQNKRYVENVF